MKRLVQLIGPAVGRDDVLRLGLARRALRRWPEIVGALLAERSCPDRYDRGVVWVAVEGSAWAQELRLAKPRILARLRELAGDEFLFEDLRFGVRPFTVLPAAEAEEPVAAPEPSDDPRSIREIAEARLARWPDRESHP